MAHHQSRFSIRQRRFGMIPSVPFIPPMPGGQNQNRFPGPSAQSPVVEKRKLPPRTQNQTKGAKKKKNHPNEKLEKTHKELKEILSKAQNDNGIIALMKYIQPSQQETYEILDRVTEDLRSVLLRCFPYFDIHPFGSAVTGLLLKDSDLDFYVRIPDHMLQNLEQVLKDVEKNLWRSRLFTKIIKIPRARVPLLKFMHIGLNVYCDVNFTNSMGIHSSGFIQHLIQFDYRIYPLMMVVKFWATTHELSGTGRITNYCLVMMVIFFLQTLSGNPLLPPVDDFQRHVPVLDVCGWNVAFNRNLKQKMLNIARLEKLLKEFFDFLSTYDYETFMMCPLFGKSYKKEDFSQAVEPPPEFKFYRKHIQNFPEDTFPNLKPLCVQDPFELKMNIGASCSPKHLNKFKACAYFASTIFRDADLNQENLSQTLMRLFFENELKVPMTKNPQKGTQNITQSISRIDAKNLLTVTLMPSKSELKMLKEIVLQNNINTMDGIKEINKYWVDSMGKFVVLMLKEIYEMTITVENQPGNSKNSSDYPKVFIISTEINVWSGRTSIKTDPAHLVEAEIAETNRLKETIQPTDPLKFSLILNTNNMYEYLQVSCIDRLMVRNSLRDFHNHFVENVRSLVNGYLQNDRAKSKETVKKSKEC